MIQIKAGQTVRYRARMPEDGLTYFAVGVVVKTHPATVFDIVLSAHVVIDPKDVLGFHHDQIAEAS